MTILTLNDVTTGYSDVPVLNGVDLNVGENESVGIIGPNGAGKSTVFKTIMGYLDPWSGSVMYQDQNLQKFTPSDRVDLGIGYVPQKENIFPKMTVRENIKMGAYTLDQSKFENNIEEMYEIFPILEERRTQKVQMMSGGEQKMVAIARALITNPDLVLFDEPSAGLMPKYISDIFDQIDLIQKENDVSFLLIEQNIPVLLEHTNRTYVLRDGSIVAARESQEYLEQDDLGEIYLGGSGDSS